MLGFTFGTVEFIIELILLAIGVFVATLVLGRRFYDDAHFTVERDETVAHVPIAYFRTRRLSLFNRDNFKVWVISLAFTLVTGLVSYFAPRAVQARTWGWGILFFIIMLAAMICLAVWWCRHGDNAVDFFWMLVAMVCMARVTAASAGLMVMGIESTWWSMFFNYISWLVPGICVIACAIDAARYWRREARRTESEDDVRRARRWTAFAWIWTALTSLVLVLLLIFEGTILGISPSPNPQPTPNPTPKSTFWGHWYCQDPQTKIDEFGPCPDNVEKMDGQQLFEEMSKRDHKDPLGFYTRTYYRDSLTNNRKLAYYYALYSNDTDAINSAIWDYSTGLRKTNGSDYILFVDEVYSWLEDHNPKYEALTGKQLAERGMDVHDQFYADVYSCRYDADGDEIPSAVVYDCGTGSENDIYLVITYKVKYRSVVEIYHANCGFQPCNASDSMRVEVKPRPNPEPTSAPSGGGKPSGGSDPTPTPTPTPTTTPTPSPTTPPSSGKNPASDPVNQGNADKGGGDNRASNGGGDYQSDPRSNADQPSAVKPQTPAVTPDHQSDAASGNVVDHQNKMNYEPDVVTDRGSSSTKPPTNSSGDGEFTPAD